jgi:hypothetical protein
MAVLNLEQKSAPPTDTTVLGRYWMFASDEDLDRAQKEIALEQKIRSDRAGRSQARKELSAQRRKEIEEALAAVEEFPDIETGL